MGKLQHHLSALVDAVGAAWRSAFAKAPHKTPDNVAPISEDRAGESLQSPPPIAPIAQRVQPPRPATPIERIYAHREELFVCAVQLLDDAHAAQQVVTETIEKALLGVKDRDKDEAPESDAKLERMIERLLVSLALVRLKALPPPMLPGLPRGFRNVGSSDGLSQGLLSSSSGSSQSATNAGIVNGAGSRESDRERDDEAGDGELGEGSQFARTAQVLTALPVEARVAVTLVVMQGRSLADAAFLLGTSEAACRFFLNHGRKLLRRALQRDLLTSDGEGRAAALLEKLTSGTTTLHDLRRNKKATIRA